METMRALPAFTDPLSESDSVSPEEIAAFLDGRITGDERERLEAYFADNPAARQELVDASRIVATMPQGQASRFRLAPLAGIAAAAIFAIVLLKPGSSDIKSAITPVERRGVAEAHAIDLIAPLEGGTIRTTESFVWRGIEGASYRLVILDASGNTILQENTTDTVLAIPGTVLNSGAGRYYWSVDAHMPDGTSSTSGNQEFVITLR